MDTRRARAAPAGGPVAVAARRHHRAAARLARRCGAGGPAADLDRLLAGPGAARIAVLESADVRELARLARVAARRMTARRSGTLICVVPHPPAPDLPLTARAESAAAFVRSAAADLDYYGVAVTGVLAVDAATAARLAGVLSTGAGTGEVYLASGAGWAGWRRSRWPRR